MAFLNVSNFSVNVWLVMVDLLLVKLFFPKIKYTTLFSFFLFFSIISSLLMFVVYCVDGKWQA